MLPAELSRRRKLRWSFAAIYFIWGSTYLVALIGVAVVLLSVAWLGWSGRERAPAATVAARPD